MRVGLFNLLCSVILLLVAGCNAPPPRELKQAALSQLEFYDPIELEVNLRAVYDDGDNLDDDNAKLAAVLFKGGVLSIRPYIDAAPWWVFAYGEKELPNHKFQFIAAHREAVGQSNSQRWSEGPMRFYAETISYMINVEPSLEASRRSIGPFDLRLVMYFDPAVGRWQVDGWRSKYDAPGRWDQNNFVRNLLLVGGEKHLAALAAAAKDARREAADRIADNLVNGGELDRGPAPGVLVNAKAKKMVSINGENGGFITAPTVNQIAAYCGGLTAGGYADWRWITETEFESMLAGARRLRDAPDNRFWAPLLSLIPPGQSAITAPLNTFNTRYEIADLRRGACGQACAMAAYDIFADGQVRSRNIYVADAVFSNPLGPRPNLLKLDNRLNIYGVVICVRDTIE